MVLVAHLARCIELLARVSRIVVHHRTQSVKLLKLLTKASLVRASLLEDLQCDKECKKKLVALKETHAYVLEQDLPELSLQLDHACNLHLFGLRRLTVIQLFVIALTNLPLRLGARSRVIIHKAASDIFFFLFLGLLTGLEARGKQIFEPFHRELVHGVQ